MAKRKSQHSKSTASEPMKRKDYEAELKKLHIELVKLQQWVVHKGLKVCVVFEGRDTAGKGGTIKAITERVGMRTLQLVSLTLAWFACNAALAGQFDGSVPLECLADDGYDCLPNKGSCGPLRPVTRKEPLFRIDFANKQVRSPFRTQLLKVAHTTVNDEALVLQGADLLFAWSALIHKQTGVLKVAVVDREGAYVVFGQCKPVATPEKSMQERLQ